MERLSVFHLKEGESLEENVDSNMEARKRKEAPTGPGHPCPSEFHRTKGSRSMYLSRLLLLLSKLCITEYSFLFLL